MFVNSSRFDQSYTVSLMPDDANGSHLLNLSRTLMLTILAPNTPLPAAASNVQATSISTSSSLTVSTSTQHVAAPHAPFTQYLVKGSRKSEVSALQTFLALDPTIYPEGTVSGYYGPATQRAVGKFQIRYHLAAAGESGYGSVGPKTRAKLNALTTP
jgi:peptidoglycan hydrolase-like protein with peptidoglycan-binding domain